MSIRTLLLIAIVFATAPLSAMDWQAKPIKAYKSKVLWLPEGHSQYQEQSSVFARYPYRMKIDRSYSNAEREMIERCQYPEHILAYNGNTAELQKLIDSGSKTFDTKDINGQTPLFSQC